MNSLILCFIEVNCGSLDPVDFTTSTSTQGDNLFMDQIRFACMPGYELDTGDLVRNCTSDAVWDGTEPTCTSKIKFGYSCPHLNVVFLFVGLMLSHLG